MGVFFALSHQALSCYLDKQEPFCIICTPELGLSISYANQKLSKNIQKPFRLQTSPKADHLELVHICKGG